ncbi:MAG: glycosyltransferase family 4 protein [Alteraurantiacibacter sp.]
MAVKGKFVCAFRGRRDDYQVPLALDDAALLDAFLTDFYATPLLATASRLLPSRLQEQVRARCKAGLPADVVRQFPVMAMREALVKSDPARAARLRDRHDVQLSQAAARLAQSNGANLFLYSAYAAEAFEAEYTHMPARILFQYHPHFEMERQILREDAMSHQGAAASATDFENVARAQRQRCDNAWRLADRIICASSFTATSLLQAGASPEKLKVASYGIAHCDNDFSEALAPPRDAGFRVLFVGSAIQRKGIHHLLKAWEMADLPAGSQLVVVARNQDRDYFDPARLPANCIFHSGVSQRQLAALYASSTVFCMPSLIEGFGQVYLESLAAGLPVLGTPNTCLPDLGGPEDGVFITPAGDAAALASHLQKLARYLPGNVAIKDRARQLAAKFSWQNFRNSIVSHCEAV